MFVLVMHEMQSLFPSADELLQQTTFQLPVGGRQGDMYTFL